jgi:hypothetical protein
MNKHWQRSILILLSFGLFACVNPEARNQKKGLFTFVDSSRYKLDTVFEQVEVDSQKLTIALMRAKWDEHLQAFDTSLASPVSLAIFTDSASQHLYFKSFESEPDDYPNCIPTLFKANGTSLHAPGPLLLSREKGYGGSGSIYQLYWIQVDGKTAGLVPVLKTSGELSYPYFLKKGQQILLFEAIWNMEQGEAHFSDHRIQITRIDLVKNQPVQQILAVTERKYQLPDNDSTAKAFIDQFKQKEPRFLGLLDF